ncbi:MAG: hypothetical protein DME25_10680 [Verrucomicrobia bacterium]|nr:MAG: hypothetical protein DME25_10680 [Verrucomicrobiota bacterium]
MKKPAAWREVSGLVWLAAAGCLAFGTPGALAFDARGGQFIGFKDFSAFRKAAAGRVSGDGGGELRGGASPNSDDELPAEVVLTSPEIAAHVQWDELIVSWNAEMPAGAYLKVEARAVYPDCATRYYTMGLWSADPALHPRESVPHQKDTDGDVSTDTLKLKRPCERLQIRLTMGGDEGAKPKMKFLGLCLTDNTATPTVLRANRAAWGKTIEVPERSQMAYPNGATLCSPTTVSMLLSYWSQTLKRPELEHDVPEIVKEVYDANWHGTGNWPFNTAYAGSFSGLRGYVTRMSDVSELEDWIACGLPMGLSLCYNKLRGKEGPPSGHLVVCVGFTKDGDAVINDPGTSRNVRKTFSRKNLITAWAHSRNAVYLIYPERARTPKDRFGHWESRTSQRKVSLKPAS